MDPEFEPFVGVSLQSPPYFNYVQSEDSPVLCAMLSQLSTIYLDKIYSGLYFYSSSGTRSVVLHPQQPLPIKVNFYSGTGNIYHPAYPGCAYIPTVRDNYNPTVVTVDEKGILIGDIRSTESEGNIFSDLDFIVSFNNQQTEEFLLRNGFAVDAYTTTRYPVILSSFKSAQAEFNYNSVARASVAEKFQYSTLSLRDKPSSLGRKLFIGLLASPKSEVFNVSVYVNGLYPLTGVKYYRYVNDGYVEFTA